MTRWPRSGGRMNRGRSSEDVERAHDEPPVWERFRCSTSQLVS